MIAKLSDLIGLSLIDFLSIADDEWANAEIRKIKVGTVDGGGFIFIEDANKCDVLNLAIHFFDLDKECDKTIENINSRLREERKKKGKARNKDLIQELCLQKTSQCAAKMRWYKRAKTLISISRREIIDAYRSCCEPGTIIVLIKGKAAGPYWLEEEYKEEYNGKYRKQSNDTDE